MKRMHMLITGRVQAVGFRYFVEEHASRLGLKGFVRNTENREVEVVAEGESDALLELHQLCEKGPRHSQVEEVKVVYDEPAGEFYGFEVA